LQLLFIIYVYCLQLLALYKPGISVFCRNQFLTCSTLTAGAVIHSHAVCSVLASQFLAQDSVFRCTELEMIKGIFGHSYTDTLTVLRYTRPATDAFVRCRIQSILQVPIIENTAHESDLAGALEVINSHLLLYISFPHLTLSGARPQYLNTLAPLPSL
jgi:hypothetical protein